MELIIISKQFVNVQIMVSLINLRMKEITSN